MNKTEQQRAVMAVERVKFAEWWGESVESLTPGSSAAYIWQGWKARAARGAAVAAKGAQCMSDVAAPEAPIHLDNAEASAWQYGWEIGYAAAVAETQRSSSEATDQMNKEQP